MSRTICAYWGSGSMTEFWIPFGTMGLALAITASSAGPRTGGAGLRFQLQSEAWINRASGGGTQNGTFTTHTYDPAGIRLRTQVYIGSVASGEAFERIEYAYFPDGLPETQSNYYSEGLESRISFRYDTQGRLDTKTIQGADGVERFRDIFGYDGSGRVVEEARWKEAAQVFVHRKTYAADGSLATDTLLEVDGSALLAVQTAVHGAGRFPDEKRESRFRRQNGVWYHVQDTFRTYDDKGLLLHSAGYEVGGKRTDSSAFTYDAYGNRTQEDRYSGAGLPLSSLVYAWKDLQVIAIRKRLDPGAESRTTGPWFVISGRAGSGWRHSGSNLLGRGIDRPEKFNLTMGR